MKAKKLATRIVLEAMSITRGSELANYWAWEMTPMPVGLPYWKQIWVGFTMALGIDFVAKAYNKRSER